MKKLITLQNNKALTDHTDRLLLAGWNYTQNKNELRKGCETVQLCNVRTQGVYMSRDIYKLEVVE